MIQQLLWSLTFRPYVTIFLLAFLALSWLEQGKLRTLIWLVSSYLVALAAEWGSINHGIPFGWYVYHYDVLEKDLVVLGVPFFDSLSFSFLSYISFSFAQFFLSPLPDSECKGRASLRQSRNSTPVLLLGAVLMVVIDLIVDPLALLGKHWFLGDIYHYPEPGIHFGVPLANYIGWFIVALATLSINQRVDEFLVGWEPNGDETIVPRHPMQGLIAPIMWAGIVLFQLGVTYWLAFGCASRPIDHERVMLQAVCGSFAIAPILALAVVRVFRSRLTWKHLRHTSQNPW